MLRLPTEQPQQRRHAGIRLRRQQELPVLAGGDLLKGQILHEKILCEHHIIDVQRLLRIHAVNILRSQQIHRTGGKRQLLAVEHLMPPSPTDQLDLKKLMKMGGIIPGDHMVIGKNRLSV